MTGVSTTSMVWRSLALALCLVGVGSCGPSSDGNVITIFFSLDEDSQDDITRLEFVAIPTAGNFTGGSTACHVASGVVLDPDDAVITLTNGELTVEITNARLIDGGALVVSCPFDEDGVEADVNLQTIECTYDIDEVSDDPEGDCPIVFSTETVASTTTTTTTTTTAAASSTSTAIGASSSTTSSTIP